jgi:hypothetical protein
MKIINIFKLEGMPKTESDQNLVVEKLFSVQYIHVKNDIDYFLVRETIFDETLLPGSRKLDPDKDSNLCSTILSEILSTCNVNP